MPRSKEEPCVYCMGHHFPDSYYQCLKCREKFCYRMLQSNSSMLRHINSSGSPCGPCAEIKLNLNTVVSMSVNKS